MATNIVFLSSDADALKVVRQHVLGCDTDEFKYSYLNVRIGTVEQLQEFNIVISPANSYGDIRGGIDMVYFKFLGRDALQQKIKDTIRTHHDGEIHIGNYAVIPTDMASPSHLVLCPTMTVPMILPGDSRNAYLFMRAAIRSIRRLADLIPKRIGGLRVLCPVPCIGVGDMNINVAAKQIRIAIDSMNGVGIIHAINMSKKEEEAGTHKRPDFHADTVPYNMKIAFMESIR
jgi:O-acetyl-ADP-ribose deacetylase (regulator of RNase III)